MTYSDFNLKKVKTQFGIQTIETLSLFESVKMVAMSSYLEQTLARNVPLALAINTEKARSELIIINILLEIKEQLFDKISLFSGIEFNVDKEQGLNGFCDYIICQSPEQLYLDVPVIALVEAKNENIIAGIGQCLAEMYAAQLFNEQEQHPIACVYGVVTSGDEWRFLKLENHIAHIDKHSYYLSDIKKIMAIFIHILSST